MNTRLIMRMTTTNTLPSQFMVMESSSQTNSRAANALRSNSKSGRVGDAREYYFLAGKKLPGGLYCSIRSGQNECQFLPGLWREPFGKSGFFRRLIGTNPAPYNRHNRFRLAVRVATAVGAARTAGRLRAVA